MTTLTDYESDPRLFLFTSLTAGSSHIITATSRLETILKANKIPFLAIDIATDEGARKLWQRRALGKKLPGLVKDGFVVGDLEMVEEWNEFGELKENIGPIEASTGQGTIQGVQIRPPEATSPMGKAKVPGAGVVAAPGGSGSPVPSAIRPKPGVDESKFIPLPGAAEIKAKSEEKEAAEETSAKSPDVPVAAVEPPTEKAEETTDAPADLPSLSAEVTPGEPIKEETLNAAKAMLGGGKEVGDHPGLDHLSAPPSAMQSGTATPTPEAAASTAVEEVEAPKEEADNADEGVGEKRRPSVTHRGSEVVEASREEVRRIERENALKEEEEGEDGKDEAVAGVQALEVGDAEKLKEQDAKDGEDAGKSVQD